MSQMKIYNSGEKLEFDTAVCLGNFDGVHIGHLRILSSLKQIASKKGLKPVMLTFNIHPENYMGNGPVTRLITCEKLKLEVLSQAGLESVYMHEFDDRTKNLSPEMFISEILIGKLSAKAVIAGFNYRFGKNREGSSETLLETGKKYGIYTEIVPAVYSDGEIVSSTLIRGYLSVGNIPRVNVLLGRNYAITGMISHGMKKGRELGFPTANLIPVPEIMYPAKGVYATKTIFKGTIAESVTNIGSNPTLGGLSTIIETHVIGGTDAVYGDEIKIEFYQRLREEKKFSSVEQLQQQIGKDIESATKYFRNGGI